MLNFEQTEKISHDLHPHFPQLREFHSTKKLEKSSLYQELKPKILKALNSYELVNRVAIPKPEPYYRVVAWNIERGMCFKEIIHFLKNHPLLSSADVYLITEADLGMARSGNRHITKEIAEALNLNYFFASSYINIGKGSGIENDIEGENEFGLHGNAILSRYPLSRPRIVSFPNPHDKMKGREKRLGQQRALIASVDLGGKELRSGVMHLNMRSTQDQRKQEVERVVKAISEEGHLPAVIGGDWNTSTYDTHSPAMAILGFWIRVAMGTHNMIRNHYPYPERFFEKKLFQMLEKNGFDYKNCNQLGGSTTHFSVESIKQFKNLREWIPNWCFKFIDWSLKEHNGRCSFKLDWFSQRHLKVLGNSEASSDRKGNSLSPQVIGNLVLDGIEASDHDAIAFDFIL